LSEQTRTITLGDRSVEYRLVRSPRRRRTIELRVDDATSVRVSAPLRTPLYAIEDFLARRTGWLQRALEREALRSTTSPPTYTTGDPVLFLGARLRLIVRERAGKPAVTRLLGALEVTIPPADEQRSAVVAALERWYRAEAEADFRDRVGRYASAMDLPVPTVRVRSQKHLWGSCSAGGTLRFNWKLVMAPPTLIDYVVVHELGHLRHPHHQKPFWDAVGLVLPDYKERRAQLRRDGDTYRL
jgi:predicted metal-dependent hydrolase